MSYRNHYSGSPWQQGGPPFGVGNYGQNYGGYNDQYQMMNAGYGRNQGYGGMYGGMNQMRSMGYGGPAQSRHYGDRMGGGGRQMSRGQMQRKRLPQRSPVGGPRSKRPNLGDNRRMSKPRRRRDSRGGSKGRNDSYNPAEPTEDVSEVEIIDGYESWKSSGEENDEGNQSAKQNGEPGADETAEGEGKDDSAKPKKKVVCYVCKVTCSTEEKYRKHQNSTVHTSKIDELVAIRRGKRETDDDKAGSDKEGKDGKRRARKPSNWCTVCECIFGGNFLAHRRTKEHRKKRDKKYPKCRPCRLGFSSSEEYRDHYKSEDHKQKSAEFHYLKGLASGSDEDEAAIKPIKIEPEEEETKMEEAPVEDAEKEKKTDEEGKKKTDEEAKKKTDEEAKPEVKTEVKTEEGAEGESEEKKVEKKESETKADTKKKDRPREPRPSGQSFVISVEGYYCKLCRKFFKDVTVAKSKHCRSIMHVEAYKIAMEEAVVQEVERQKLADEQDKLDREAAEAAELAADIVAVERSAKETARREALAKKKEALKSQDVEMKDAGEAKKDDVKSEEKMDTVVDQNVENGEKEDSEETKVVKEEKAAEEKGAEMQDESPDAEDEGDEEQEKAKEEVTTSSGGKRGRGRGRGRKRR